MGASNDTFGTDEEIAREAIRKLKTSRKSIADCKEELETIKKNVGLTYKGEGATAYAATSTTLNTALEGVLQKFMEIEHILEEFVDTTVDDDQTNKSNMSI